MMYERDEKKLKRKVENDFFNTRRISQLSTTGFFFSSTFFLYFSLFSSTWAASDVRQEEKPSQTTTAIVSSSMKSMSKWHAMHRWMSNCRDRKRRRRKKKKTWRNFFFRNCENDKCRAIEAAPATIPKTWIGRNRLQQKQKRCNMQLCWPHRQEFIRKFHSRARRHFVSGGKRGSSRLTNERGNGVQIEQSVGWESFLQF